MGEHINAILYWHTHLTHRFETFIFHVSKITMHRTNKFFKFSPIEIFFSSQILIIITRTPTKLFGNDTKYKTKYKKYKKICKLAIKWIVIYQQLISLLLSLTNQCKTGKENRQKRTEYENLRLHDSRKFEIQNYMLSP